MKLKYYMRGLGIGIVLTTLIFTFSSKEEKLTDQQIINRAKTLGMVTEEEHNAKLEQVIKDSTPTGEPVNTPVVEPTLDPGTTPSITPTTAPTVPPEPTVNPTPTIIVESNSDQMNGKDISFIIKSGMSSRKVAKLLVQVGLVEDEGDFNDYIIEQDKAKLIRVGKYTIPEGASYSEIIKVITSK